jgi:predicted enzyme related to lactoylglutathione lyase
MARINYVELPSKNFAASKRFYATAFGWNLTEFGPTYAATMTGDVDLGLQGDASDASVTKAPLVVIDVDDLEHMLDAVQRAGGEITHPIFQFPGGRRFHFRDPSGNELAAVKGDEQPGGA